MQRTIFAGCKSQQQVEDRSRETTEIAITLNRGASQGLITIANRRIRLAEQFVFVVNGLDQVHLQRPSLALHVRALACGVIGSNQ